MYRDEILAIGEAVLEARSKGESEARRELNPRVNDLENAVRVLYRFAKKVSAIEVETLPATIESEDPAVYGEDVREKLGSANRKIYDVRGMAIDALSLSRVQYIRPRIPDGEDVPF